MLSRKVGLLFPAPFPKDAATFSDGSFLKSSKRTLHLVDLCLGSISQNKLASHSLGARTNIFQSSADFSKAMSVYSSALFYPCVEMLLGRFPGKTDTYGGYFSVYYYLALLTYLLVIDIIISISSLSGFCFHIDEMLKRIFFSFITHIGINFILIVFLLIIIVI